MVSEQKTRIVSLDHDPERVDSAPRRTLLLWLSSLAAGVALIGSFGRRTGEPGTVAARLEPGRAGHDPCLNPSPPRGRVKELS